MGLHAIFLLQQAGVKHEMSAYLKKNIHPDIETITLSSEHFSQIAWEDKSEFYLNGQMYDVIEISRTGRQTIIRCINDKKETELANSFYNHSKEESHQKAKDWVKLLTLPFEKENSETIVNYTYQPINYSPFITESIRDRTSALLKPPAIMV